MDNILEKRWANICSRNIERSSLSFLKRFRDFYKNHLGPGSFSYGILHFCKRCVFRGRYETIAIISLSKKNTVTVIQNYKGKHYIRKGECIGFDKCGKCLESIDKEGKGFPCKWFIVRQ